MMVEAVLTVNIYCLLYWQVSQAIREGETYSVQASSTKDSLDSGLYAASIPLQVPHDCSSVQLRKHCHYLFDMFGIDLTTAMSAGRLRGWRCWSRKPAV